MRMGIGTEMGIRAYDRDVVKVCRTVRSNYRRSAPQECEHAAGAATRLPLVARS